MAVIVFGAVLWAIWRAGELQVFQAFCAALVGFFLASSAIAPSVSAAVQTVFDWISTWSIS